LCKSLEESLRAAGASSVDFRRLDWTGENHHYDRRLASIKLRRQLTRQIKEDPDALHFVVAHSHGGNASLAAVGKSPRLRRSIAGIVCLATPYLRFEPQTLLLTYLPAALLESLRWVGAVLSSPLGIFALIGGVLSFLIGYPMAVAIDQGALTTWFLEGFGRACESMLGESVCSYVGSGLSILVYSLVGVSAAGMALGSGWRRAKQKMQAAISSEQDRLLRRFAYWQPEHRFSGVPVLSMSSPFDEALAVLAGAWWVHRATGWFARLGSMLAIGAACITFCLLYYWLAMFALSTRDSRWLFPLWEYVMPLALIISGIALLLATRLFVKLFAFGAARSNFGAGLPNPDTNLIWRVRAYRDAYSLPVYVSHRFSLLQLLIKTRALLFHSRVYSFPPALRLISEWMLNAQANTLAAPVQCAAPSVLVDEDIRLQSPR
jgi:hypothetical protein